MSLLSIAQGAAAALSLPVPASIVGNTEAHAISFLQLAKQEGRQLMRRHDWQALVTGAFPTTLATVLQTALPSDFDRLVPYSKLWNTTLDMVYAGPVDTHEWQRLVFLDDNSSPGTWRFIGGFLHITPAPTAGESLAFEYISKDYCESSGGTNQSDWAADADVGRVPEHLVELGLIWRWLRSKGMDYAEEFNTYEREVERAAARDRGVTATVISSRSGDFLDPTWPGTITEV